MTSRNCSTGRYWLPGGGNERILSLPSVMWFLWKDRSAAISVSPQFPQNNLRLISVFESRGKKSTVSVIVDVPVLWHNFQHLIYSFYHHLFKPLYKIYAACEVSNHTSDTGKCQLVSLSERLLLFLFFFLRSIGLPALSLINHQNVVGGWDGLLCQQRHAGETAGFHPAGRRLTWTQHT